MTEDLQTQHERVRMNEAKNTCFDGNAGRCTAPQTC